MSAGLYIHIPFCRSRCDYCSFVSCIDTSKQDEYYKCFKNQAYSVDYNGDFDTVYFGGGTPSVVPKLLEKMYGFITRTFSIKSGSEITVECNPDSVDSETLKALENIRCNRVSLGLQSTDDDLLKSIGRRHNFAQFVDALKQIQKITQNVSADIMLGLPNQSLESVVQSVKQTLELGIKHISVYSLKVEQGTPLYKRGFVVDEDLQADMYDAVYEEVKKFGFERYEVSNFCLKGFESRHNYKYWSLEDYIGLGAAAHSYYGGKRYEGVGLQDYLKDKQPIVTDVSDDYEEELIMLSLRTKMGLELARLGEGKEKFFIRNQEKLKNYIKQGLIEVDEKYLHLTEKAFYIMNSIIVDLI